MALKPIYTAPEPKLPAYANVNLHDFKTPQLAPTSKTRMIQDMRMTSRNPTGAETFGRTPMVGFGQTKTAPLSGVPFRAPTIKPFEQTAGPGPIALPKSKLATNLAGAASTLAPYASNVANLFSKPGLPPAPTQMSPVNFERVSLDAERASAEQEARGMDVASDRMLDGNSAVASRAASYAGKIKAFSGINSAERRENAEITNRETQVNAGIQARNNQGTDQFNRDLVDRNNVIQSNRSDNMANASEKFIEGKNQDALRQLDKDKLKVLSRMSPDVWARLMDKLKKDGYDPTA